MNQDDLILAHLRELLKVEAETVKDLLVLYRQETRRILDELAITPDDTFRFQYLSKILAQLEAGVLQMEARISGKVAAEVAKAHGIGLKHAGKELAGQLRLWPQTTLQALAIPEPAALVVAFEPLINLDSLRALQEVSRLSTKRWAAGEISSAQQVVTKAILEKKSPKQAAAELAKVMGPKAKAHEIERIARTEVWKATNDAYRTGNEVMAERYPDLKLKHRWVAVLDKACRTGVCPNGLHGLEVPVGELFKARAPHSWSGMAPPVHPHCRCRLVVVTPPIKAESLEEKRKRIQAKLDAL